MAKDDRQIHLVLLKGDDPGKALTMFERFVKDTGGNGQIVNDERDLFDQWKKDLKDGEDGVCFTRPQGTDGLMTAQVLKITATRKLTNCTVVQPKD